ncbi:MAG TPA: hypothetical protein VKT70_12435 [Stellaceae bacterium]|nr:hypothetical protein [Stellaceae bacterium]
MNSDPNVTLKITAVENVTAVLNNILAAASNASSVIDKIGGALKDLDKIGLLSEQSNLNHLLADGLSPDALNKVTKALGDAGVAYRVSHDQLDKMFESFLDAGGALKDFTGDLPTLATALQRAKNEGAALGKLTGELAKGFKIADPAELSKTFAIFNDQLDGVAHGFETFVKQGSDLEQLYANIGHSGRQAATEVSGLFAAIAKTSGLDKATSGTNGLLQQLGDQDGLAKLTKAGINTTDDQGNVRSITDIVHQLAALNLKDPNKVKGALDQTAFDGLRGVLDEAKQNNGATPTFDNALKAGGDLGKFNESGSRATAGLSDALTGLDSAFKKVAADNLTGPINLLAAALTHLTTPLADVGLGISGLVALKRVTGWLGEAKDAVGGTITAISKIPGGISAAQGALVNGFAKLSVLTETLGRLTAFTPALNGVFSALSRGFIAVGVAIETTPIGWILTGIVAIAAAAFLIYEYWGPIKEFFGGLWDGIKNVFAGVVQFFTDLFRDPIDAIIGLWEPIKGFFGGVWDGVKAIFAGVIDFFGDLFGGAINFIFQNWEPIKGFFGAIWEGVKAIFAGVGAFFGGIFEGAVGLIFKIWEPIKGFFTGLWDGIKDAFGAGVEWIAKNWDRVVKIILAPIDAIKEIIAWVERQFTVSPDHDKIAPVKQAVSAIETKGTAQAQNAPPPPFIGHLVISLDPGLRIERAESNLPTFKFDFDNGPILATGV